MNKFTWLIFVLFAFFAQAEIVDTHQFKNNEDRIRAVALAKSLRCPQCQNQNLVESNSPIAYDLRLEVYKMIDEGKSDAQIIDVMTQRFGNFVLYKPPLEWNTALLWIFPIGLAVLAMIFMSLYLRQRTKIQKNSTALNAEQKQSLHKLLSKTGEK